MASSVVLKRFLAPNALKFSSLMDVRPAVASRFFSKNALVSDYDSAEDDRSDLDVDRGSGRGVSSDRRGFRLHPFSDVFDMVPATRSLSEVLNLMDRMTEFTPFSSSFRGASPYRAWDAKETEEALHLRMDMPGLGKEDVRVSVEQNTLVIKGEEQEKSKDENAETGRKYSSRIDLPEKMYNTGEIKAEMKNGVLKVTVPKVKEEERADVFHVQIN